MSNDALPLNLKGKRHTDFPWPMSLIPRAWTAFSWGSPVMVKGNQHLNNDCSLGLYCAGHPLPIGEPGSWQLSRFPKGPRWAWYFAFTTKGRVHFRIGARWDNEDNYVEFPSIAVKRGIK